MAGTPLHPYLPLAGNLFKAGLLIVRETGSLYISRQAHATCQGVECRQATWIRQAGPFFAIISAFKKMIKNYTEHLIGFFKWKFVALKWSFDAFLYLGAHPRI